MTTPPDRDGSRSPRVEPVPGVVLVCESCDHIWEPSPDELGAGPMPCTQCEGWTTIAELATTAENTGTAGDSPASTGKLRTP
jgi:hypothetical protein